MNGSLYQLALWSLAILAIGSCSKYPHTYEAHFSSGNGLVPYTKILMSGIEVGYVANVLAQKSGESSSGLPVSAELKLQMPLREGSKASIRNRAPIGEVIIRIDPGPADAPLLTQGAVIARTRVAARVEDIGELIIPLIEGIDLEKVGQLLDTMSDLSQRFSASDVDQTLVQLGTTMQALADLMEFHREDLNEITRIADKLAQQLDASELDSLITLYDAFSDASDRVQRLETTFNTLLQQVEDQLPEEELTRARQGLQNALRAAEEIQSFAFLEIVKRIAQMEGATGTLFRRPHETLLEDIAGYTQSPATSTVTE